MTTLPEPTIGDEGRLGGVYTWESQARQYDKLGPPGIRHESHEVTIAQVEHKPTGTVVLEAKGTVDCLLYRNSKGHLVGILNHYNEDAYDWDGTLLERAGNCNIWVRPNRRRRGIGSALVRAALKRWPDLDYGQQSYTAAGRALVESIIVGLTS